MKLQPPGSQRRPGELTKALNDLVARSTAQSRAEFVKSYLKLNWPEYQLYDATFNTGEG